MAKQDSTPANSRAVDHTGRTFGQLLAVARIAEFRKPTKYRCECTCGNSVTVLGSNLIKGHQKSCGCLKLKHGMARTTEHKIWVGMWGRCTNQNGASYSHYKNRVPPESWRDFSVFFSDVGPRPGKGYSLDRIDNEKPYGPGNVQWATRKQQSNNAASNVMLTYGEDTMNVTQWAERIGIKPCTLHGRLRLGWSVEKTLTTPKKR